MAMRNPFNLLAMLVVCSATLTTFVGSATAQTEIMYTTKEIGFNRPGSDIKGITMIIGSPWQLCTGQCRAEKKCLSWTWVRDGVMSPYPMCWLKGALPAPVADPVAVSGVITEKR
jgi:hypothetical protein